MRYLAAVLLLASCQDAAVPRTMMSPGQDDDLNGPVRVGVETVKRGLPADRRRAVRQQHGNRKQ